MAKFKDHQMALTLRKQGMSYSQIKKILKVSKSTLSAWLKDYPLSKKRIRELRDWNEQRIEKCRETKRKKKEERLNKFCKEQKRIIFPFDKRELYLAGLFLYWGEGAKVGMCRLSVSNTDPSIIKFFMDWLIKSLKVPKEKLKVHLHLYKDMNIAKEIKFWSEILNIPISQFNKPYIKKTDKASINHKGSFGHGTCNVKIGDARLTEKILMGLKSISDYYLSKNI
ncbi:helix-turn-helix domain-containing protein [Candidatus Parcubacteria bacterium]|nr:helix-turn-helix domain-containing protein [Candidatus Parcubacteria bacterium]